jgi:N6-adenosine-specific RNA methylase IME4/ParB-like chromosome segregation protein Spo0J
VQDLVQGILESAALPSGHPGTEARKKDHPFAALFPLLSQTELAELAADIATNGLRDPVMLHRGMILDGRNRYRACLLKDLPARYEFYTGTNDDALDYVISKNVHRRHLTLSQRALAMASYEEYRHGGARRNLVFQDANLQLEGVDPAKPAPTRAELAERGRVSERLIASAAVVRDEGAPELSDAVRAGDLAVSTAALIARLPKEEQVRLLQQAAPDAVKVAAKQINARAREERRENVNRLHAVLSENSAPLPLDRKYPVIYADPATRFEAGFSGRSIENHYPTEMVEDWCKLPVKDLALPDCRLFVWTTIPQLARTIELLLPAWGFAYVSCCCWDKTSPEHEREAATGYWFRNQHEILLLATRGAPALPPPAEVPVSMYRERKTGHSAKPDFYREMIERMTPGLPRIELFARSQREGWIAWGNQAQRGEAA